jgi:hypothetical protein
MSGTTAKFASVLAINGDPENTVFRRTDDKPLEVEKYGYHSLNTMS